MAENVDKNAVYNLLDEKMNESCLGEENCGTCDHSSCIIAYAKDYISKCREIQARETGTHIVDGIPASDSKFYNESNVIENIGKLLTMCHSCETNHSDDCVINVVRSCLECIAFGESYDYPGNALTYLMTLSMNNQEKANEIMEIYKANK